MTNDGGRANEPTSYGLRPPQNPQAHNSQDAHNPYNPQQSRQPYVPPQEPQAPPGAPHGSPYQPTQTSSPPPPPPPDPSAGRALGGRYRLVSRLGHGGMGTVWLAHDEVVDRDVAIKEPRVPDHLSELERANVYERMRREAKAAARIEHPAVVTMHDVVIEDDKPWIVMELVRGHSLADRLQEGTLDPREAARIGLQVLGALTAAHESAVLHRDVKPDNVLLGRGDRVVLSDFGIAQVEGEQGLTETGAFVGSPEFISPERVLGRRPGPESDLWSLGVVLYAAVEGVSPYRRSNTPATLQAVLSAEPQMPARAWGEFGVLVMRLLSKDPAARPAAAEIRRTLESVARPPVPAATRLYTGSGPDGGGTRATAGAGGSGGDNKWVPPILHRNRPAQYGLGGGLLAVVLALVMIFFNPFAADEMPEDWGIRPEKEIIGGDVGVPKEYKRTQGDGDNAVTYSDPSGVFGIYVERVESLADNKIPKPDPNVWKTYYESGGQNETEIENADVRVKDASYKDKKDVFETVVDYTWYSDSADDPVRHRWHELIVPVDEGDDAYWRLRVSMPAEGAAVKDGEEMFATVVKYLDLRTGPPPLPA